MEEESKVGKKGRVCVTGGSGFIASWLIKRLLEDGYSVNATVRSSTSPVDDIWKSLAERKNICYLTDLSGASERLRIFNADLDEPESFDPAIEGCIGVFLVAHPMEFAGKESEQVLLERSVNGTTRILRACLNSKTVKRVVYTSSASTVILNDKELDIMDETTWSDVDYIRTKLKDNVFSTYAITKTSAEKASFEFAEANGMDLVSIIPTWVHGPFICPFWPGSVWSSMAMILGKLLNFRTLPLLIYFLFICLKKPSTRKRLMANRDALKVNFCLALNYLKKPVCVTQQRRAI